VLGGIGESAGAAGAHAARYSASLAQLAGALIRGDTDRGIEDAGTVRSGAAPRKLADVVAEAIADTGAMRSRIDGLQQRLADSRREIDRLRDEVRRAREESLSDSLTGLSNRRAFEQALAACLAAPTPAATARDANAAIEAARALAAGRSTAAASTPAAGGPWLLMSDIDHFRRINDVFGHDFGDQVLKAVAEAMRTLVPAGATLARVGGEAFALLVPTLDAAGALALAERVRAHIGSARIRRPDQGEAERVTLSVGVACGVAGETPQALLERASAALQEAKDGGRDRVVSR
jgi:diguanylate cyclase